MAHGTIHGIFHGDVHGTHLNGTPIFGGTVPLAITNVTVSNSPYTIKTTDQIIMVDTTSGAVTLNLPNPTTFSTPYAYVIIDQKGQFATNNVTLVPFSTELIEGLNTSKVFQTAWGAWNIVTDKTNWFVY